jgi:hypothetical protein
MLSSPKYGSTWTASSHAPSVAFLRPSGASFLFSSSTTPSVSNQNPGGGLYYSLRFKPGSWWRKKKQNELSTNIAEIQIGVHLRQQPHDAAYNQNFQRPPPMQIAF